MVAVAAVVQLASGELWRTTQAELDRTLSAVEREVAKGKPWALAIRDLVASHIQAADEILQQNPVKRALLKENLARAKLRVLARRLQDHLRLHELVPLAEVLEIVEMKRIYREAVVDDVHAT